MLANGARAVGTAIRGVDPPEEERKAVGLAQRITATAASRTCVPGGWRIILGRGARRRSSACAAATRVVLIAPEGAATPDGIVPRMRRFTVAGTFDSGMYEFDRGLALIDMTDAARLYRFGDRVTGVRLALDDPLRAPADGARPRARRSAAASTSATGRATTRTSSAPSSSPSR